MNLVMGQAYQLFEDFNVRSIEANIDPKADVPIDKAGIYIYIRLAQEGDCPIYEFLGQDGYTHYFEKRELEKCKFK